MDFGGGFATGMGAGMGSGIAIGITSGKKQALNQLREHVEQNGITIHDRYGAPIKVNDLLENACGQTTCCSSERKWGLIAAAFVLAVGVAVAIGIFVMASM